MNQSINTDSKNSKEPQQKYRLGTVSIKILGGLNRFCESDARPTGVQLKREATLLTVIGLNTKHADCRIVFMLYPIRL